MDRVAFAPGGGLSKQAAMKPLDFVGARLQMFRKACWVEVLRLDKQQRSIGETVRCRQAFQQAAMGERKAVGMREFVEKPRGIVE